MFVNNVKNVRSLELVGIDERFIATHSAELLE
jgi:hypothetical protein